MGRSGKPLRPDSPEVFLIGNNMRAGRGKGKGAAYERDICKRLSRWVSSHKREDVFWRAAMSGGRATVQRRKGETLHAHAGDISCTHSCGELLTEKFFCECKHYKDLQLSQVSYGKLGMLRRFWLVARKQAKQYGKQALLFARQNQQPDIVVTSTEGFRMLSSLGRIPVLATFRNDMTMFLLRDLITLPYSEFVNVHKLQKIPRERLLV